MRKDSFKVFLIIEGLNALVRVPITTFICQDREQAKLYFQNYIKNLKTATYSLYEIFEATKNEMNEKRIFITSSLNIQTHQISLQEERKRIEEAKKEKEKKMIIKKLFDAVEV